MLINLVPHFAACFLRKKPVGESKLDNFFVIPKLFTSPRDNLWATDSTGRPQIFEHVHEFPRKYKMSHVFVAEERVEKRSELRIGKYLLGWICWVDDFYVSKVE